MLIDTCCITATTNAIDIAVMTTTLTAIIDPSHINLILTYKRSDKKNSLAFCSS